MKLVRSYISLWLSRGEPYSMATYSAACSLTVILLLNLVTLYAVFFKLPWFKPVVWIVTTPWSMVILIGALLATNFYFAKKQPAPEVAQVSTEMFYWHAGVSIVMFVIAGAIALA